ncbi:hypothetical protein Q7P37_010447 [Cladosporium fusiforme]
MEKSRITSVAIIGAGASGTSATARDFSTKVTYADCIISPGTAAASAFAAENYFSRIQVFERREAAGGTWIYDDNPGSPLRPSPGCLPPDLDPPIEIPESLPSVTSPVLRERFQQTPIYSELTTNVPSIAMAFSDHPFPYGPFVPHWVPKQYIQSYLSIQGIDELVSFNTTVEDVTRIPRSGPSTLPRWSLTLRRHDPIRNVDEWWRDEFDALIIATGHYSVPFIPAVPGLDQYMERFPEKVFHSKSYRSAAAYRDKRVLVIGNSASGHDVSSILATTVTPPLYQSRRSKSRWDGNSPPSGIVWKPIIARYDPTSGTIHFVDGTQLESDEVDYVIYCTGYKPSFPWWHSKVNGGDLWDYRANRLIGSYQHTFFRSHPTLGLVGMPRTLTFRSFEYQAVALARVFAGRNRSSLPSEHEMQLWEQGRDDLCRRERRKFHDIPWENGETLEFFNTFFELAGLPLLEGDGRSPPVLDGETRWAVEHIRKYPEPGNSEAGAEEDEDGWTIVKREKKDLLHFI